MQSQEESRQEQAAVNEQGINPDPREQRQAPQGQQEYRERPYTEGYAGLDTEEPWSRPGEKIYPKVERQRGIEGPLLFILLLCALVVAGMIFSIVITWLSWMLLTVLIVAGCVIAIMNWRVVTIPMPLQTFQMQDHPQLVIRDGSGSISIRRGEGNVVTVAATRRMSGIGMTPENMRVDYSLQDNMLNVTTHTRWDLLQFGIRHFDLVITVPEGCDIQLSNGSGKIDVQGVSGTIDLRTGSGTIEASALQGQIALRTGSGSIEASALQGQVELKSGSGSIAGTGIRGQLMLLTGSGRIELEQAALAGNSRLKTGSGRVSFVGELDPRGNYNMVTGSGRVTLTLPTDASFRLNASTGSGGILNDFGSIEAGTPPRAQLRIKTGSGTIQIRKNDAWSSSL